MIQIKVPATSANIGPGFDAIGLAVDLYNYVTFEESDRCEIYSLDNLDIPTDESNLIYCTVKRLYEICGKRFAGMKIGQVNNIPFARGLGSSSACIIAGLKGANHILGSPLSDDDLIDLAAEMEGHPDNSTPALTGGLVTAVIDSGKVYYVKQEIKNDLHFVAIIPDFELKTAKARAVLPNQVSRKDAIFNLSRAALMSVSLYSGNYQNIRVAAQDRLHQPYRLGLIKDSEAVMESCYALGAYACFISGAGSTLMAIVDAKKDQFGTEISKILAQMNHPGWKVHTLSIDNVGTIIERV